MKKVLCLLLVVLMFSCIPAMAAGKLEISQETFYVMPYYSDNYAGYVYAEVENVGDKPVVFNGGLLELFNADGDSIEANDYVSCYPSVLNPGEKGYIYVSQDVEEATTPDYIDDYLLTVTGKGEDYWTEYYLFGEVENDTDQICYNVELVYVVKDATGKLLYCESDTLYEVGIMPGMKIATYTELSSSLIEFLEENALSIDQVEVIAYMIQEA